MNVAAALLLAAALGAPATAPTLSAAPPSGGADAEPARALPATVTICIDRQSHRCWTAAGDDACAGGAVFAHAAANEAPGAQLAPCWQELKH